MESRDTPGLSVSEGRRFGLTVGGAFLALGGVLTWRGHLMAAETTGALGLLLCLAGLAIPRRLGPIQSAWMGLAHAISRVTTPMLMSVIYFLVITPSGWLVRLFGHRPLQRSGDGGSFWVDRSTPTGDLERQF